MGERVQFHRAFSFFDRFVEPAERKKCTISEPVVSGGVVRIRLKRALKFRLRLRKFKVKREQHAQRAESFGRRLIQLDRSTRCYFCLGKEISWRARPENED